MNQVGLNCDYCGNYFEKKVYRIRYALKINPNSKFYCNKWCAMVGARESFRPLQESIVSNSGYRMIRKPEHPFVNSNNQVPYSRLVMEKSLGRVLQPGETVHHKDGDKLNDELTNLEIMNSKEHRRSHVRRDFYGRFTYS